MDETVVLSNAEGNFTVALSPEDARNVIKVQAAERRPMTARASFAAMSVLAAAAGFGFGVSTKRSRYAGEICTKCGASQPPGKPRLCKSCREV